MDFETIAILGFTAYKLTGLGVGLISSHMGYRLFMAGVWGSPSELKASAGNNRLLLKSAAPGLFFALFGTCVIVVSMWKGFNVEVPHGMQMSDLPPAVKPSLPDL